jgi:hypothetical protein
MENPSSTIVRVYGFYRDMANIYEQQLPVTIVSIELVSILYKLSGISGQQNLSANPHVRSFADILVATQRLPW